MPRRTVILIIILTILTGVLVFLAVQNEQRKVQAPDMTVGTESPTQQPVSKTATVSFDPMSVQAVASTRSASTVDVILDSKEHTIDSIQLEFVYDPAILSNVTVVAPESNFFGDQGSYTVFPLSDDPQRGRASYAVGISPEREARQGIGVVAQISFSVNPQSTASATEIQVLDRSMANEPNSHQSVLAPVEPLTITIVR